jgi:polyisoprenyl-teichoic acid--peptidoglycan teichoic acid transferase
MRNDDKKIREQAFQEIRHGGSGGAKKQAKRSRAKTVLAASLLMLLGAATVAGGLVVRILINTSPKSSISSKIGSITNPRGQFPKKERITVLLIGKDYNRYFSKKDKTLNQMPFTKGARSDSIMLLSLDLENKKVSALSIPRDTYVRAPDGKTGKINGTYARGGEKLLRATVAQLLGVTPDYFVAIKPDAVKAIVDKLGGVEVETIDRMKYDDYWGQLHVDLPKGKQHIDGTQAVGFARFREVNITAYNPDGTPVLDRRGRPVPKAPEHSKEEGDPRRMARQQQLIRAMANKGKSFNNLLQLDKIVTTSLEQLETDLDDTQIFALAALFRTAQPEQMQTGTLPGEGHKRGTWFFFVDTEKSKAMVDWLIRGNEEAANRLTVVAVQNGTAVPGAASKVMQRLKKEGFDARNGGNAQKDAKGDLSATRIVFTKAAVLPRAQKIAALIGGGTLVKEPKPDKTGVMGLKADEMADVKVILGRDLAAQFGSQSASRF